MTNWMRRRIERSRARCEKAASNHKPEKHPESEKQSRLADVTPPGSNAKCD